MRNLVNVILITHIVHSNTIAFKFTDTKANSYSLLTFRRNFD